MREYNSGKAENCTLVSTEGQALWWMWILPSFISYCSTDAVFLSVTGSSGGQMLCDFQTHLIIWSLERDEHLQHKWAAASAQEHTAPLGTLICLLPHREGPPFPNSFPVIRTREQTFVVPSEQSKVKRIRLQHTKHKSMGGTKDPCRHRVTEYEISAQEIKGTDGNTAEPWCSTDTRQMFAAFAPLPDPSVVSGQSSIYSVASATRFFFPAWQLLISVLATTLLLHLLSLPCSKRNLVSLHINSKCLSLISVLLGQSFSCL